jgi:pimeloyl-ACP methyl ester carboxylesterase
MQHLQMQHLQIQHLPTQRSFIKPSDLYSITAGHGPPVVLIHGIAASHLDWRNLVPDLISSGFRVHALDLLGHGDSVQPDDPQVYTVRTVYAALEDWIESLDLPEPPILVGHSLGGYLSLKYSLRRPAGVRAMVLINPYYTPRQFTLPARLVRRRPALSARALRMIPEAMLQALVGWDPITGRNFSAEVRQQNAADLKRASPHVLYLTRTMRDLSHELNRVGVSTYVLWGDKDLTLKPNSFPRLIDELPAAYGQPVTGCGHQPHLNRPEVVNRLVLDFAARQSNRVEL